MLTTFGKTLRRIRIDNDELLRDMAVKLNVTPSFLSAVENGKKKIPNHWVNKISSIYKYDLDELQKAEENSQLSLKINLKELETNDKKLMLSFARKFDELDEQAKKDIKEILKNFKK